MTKVFLIGFMGAGKSSSGRYVANRLAKPFFDLDDEIEKWSGKSIPEIFESSGEEAFRKMERECLERFLRRENGFVMACGGGTPCYFDNMELMNKAGLTVWLDLPPGMLARRLKTAKKDRPLLKKIGDLEEFIRLKIEERSKWYRQAQLRIKGTNTEKRALSKAILEYLHEKPQL